MSENVPRSVCAVIEVPKWSFIKRELHKGGEIDFVSPVPCPFNYGYVLGMSGGDGDPMDALVLGPRCLVGTRRQMPVVGVVRFRDGGVTDDKLVLSDSRLQDAQVLCIRAFFVLYAYAKKGLNAWRGVRGSTEFIGIERVG